MDTYTHGHADAVLQSHRWRTVANSAAYLVPHLRAGQGVRRRAGRQHEGVVRDGSGDGQHRARDDVEADGAAAPPQVDVVRRVQVVRSRAVAQRLLGQRGPVVGRQVLLAEQDDRPGVARAAELARHRRPGEPGPDDDDRQGHARTDHGRVSRVRG